MPPVKAPKRLTLADLSDDDRRALLEEAREQAKRNPVDVDGYEDLSDREKLIRGLMDARDHLRGCPVQEGRELGRVEGYDATRPANPAAGEGPRKMTVIRCVECGGTSTMLGELEANLEAAELELVAGPAGGEDETP